MKSNWMVLIVDDDAGDRELHRRALEDLSRALGVEIQVLTADSFDSGLALVSSHKTADILVVDGEIGLDYGYELVSQVLAIGFRGQIIAASSSKVFCLRMLAAGAHRHCNGNKSLVVDIIRDIITN